MSSLTALTWICWLFQEKFCTLVVLFCFQHPPKVLQPQPRVMICQFLLARCETLQPILLFWIPSSQRFWSSTLIHSANRNSPARRTCCPLNHLSCFNDRVNAPHMGIHGIEPVHHINSYHSCFCRFHFLSSCPANMWMMIHLPTRNAENTEKYKDAIKMLEQSPEITRLAGHSLGARIPLTKTFQIDLKQLLTQHLR